MENPPNPAPPPAQAPPPPATPPPPAPPAATPPPPGGALAATPPADDAAALRAQLETERTARAAESARLKALEDAEEARKTASLSEIEREKARADKAEQDSAAKDARLHRAAVLGGIGQAATALGVEVDAQPVRDLYDAGVLKGVKLDDAGDPLALDAALKAAIAARPYIVKAKAPAPDINATKAGAATGAQSAEERQAELRQRYRRR